MPVFTRDVLRIFVRVDLHHFRVPVDQSWPGRVQVQCAKVAAQPFLLLGSHRLVAKKKDAMFGQGRLYYLNRRFVQPLRQVNPAHFSTAVRGHLFKIKSLVMCHVFSNDA